MIFSYSYDKWCKTKSLKFDKPRYRFESLAESKIADSKENLHFAM